MKQIHLYIVIAIVLLIFAGSTFSSLLNLQNGNYISENNNQNQQQTNMENQNINLLSLVDEFITGDKLESDERKVETLNGAVKYVNVLNGSGDLVEREKTISVDYVGVVIVDGENVIFDQSTTDPLSFVYGGGNIIVGFEEGIKNMRVGGIRVVKMSPEVAYGAASVGQIPANSTLYFIIRVVNVS